jgi:hypothetical protein
MRKVCRFLNLLLGTLFIAGVLWYVLFIHSLPSEIFISLQTNHILLPSYLLLACGLLVIIFSQAIGGSSEKELVYVDKITKAAVSTTDKENDLSENEASERNILEQLHLIAAGEPDLQVKTEKILFYLGDKMQAGQGIIYKVVEQQGKTYLNPFATYAYSKDKNEPLQFELGEGLAGLAAKENKVMLLDNIPQGYIKVFSGLGSASPTHLLLLPLLGKDKVAGVLELALFEKPKVNPNVFFKELSARLGNLLIGDQA